MNRTEIEKEKKRPDYNGAAAGVVVGIVLTVGAIIVIVLSGLGGHGSPQNPIAETILFPGAELLHWAKGFEDDIPQGAGGILFFAAFILNVGVWGFGFRLLVWPLLRGNRQPRGSGM